MVIADEHKPSIAGVMGGLDSGTLLPRYFLESAYFILKSIAYAARHFNLGSESYRFGWN